MHRGQVDGEGNALAGSNVVNVAAGQEKRRRLQWLDEVQAAAAQVTQLCQAMRTGPSAEGAPGADVASSSTAQHSKQQQQHTSTAGAAEAEDAQLGSLERQHRAQLQQAAAKLRRLLDAGAAGATQQLDGAQHLAGAVVAAGSCNAADSSALLLATASGSTSRLLALPDELLTRVARQAGQDARLGCVQLRDAYGCPGTVIAQPMSAHHLGTDDTARMLNPMLSDPVYRMLDEKHVQRAVLGLFQPPRDCWDVLRQFRARPTWGTQVTRLQLAEDFSPDLELVQAARSALPNLRELQCAWWDFRGGLTGALAPDDRVPALTALTALTAMCALPYAAARHSSSSEHRNARGGFAFRQVALLAPSLQSLSMDLRCQTWGKQLTELGRLSRLTRLSVTFPKVSVVNGPVIQLLEALAGRLHSLSLRTYRTVVGIDLGPVLHSMTALTALQLCDDRIPDGVLPESWEHLRGLRQLQLGCFENGWHWLEGPPVGGSRAGALLTSVQAGLPPGLADVSLPLVHVRGARELEQLRGVLAAAAARCTGLTRLRLGAGVYPDDTAYLHPQPSPWLAPAGAMLRLQRLAVVLPLADLAQLAPLGALPLLDALWLHLQCDPEASAAPAAAVATLSGLASVRDLTLVLEHIAERDYSYMEDPGAPQVCDGIVAGLLVAAAGMPRLEVLDTLGLVACSGSCGPWQAFAAQPLPRLRLLVLRFHTRGERDEEAQRQCVRPEDAAAAVEGGRLGPQVAVCREARKYYNVANEYGSEDPEEMMTVVPWSLKRPACDADGCWSGGVLGQPGAALAEARQRGIKEDGMLKAYDVASHVMVALMARTMHQFGELCTDTSNNVW